MDSEKFDKVVLDLLYDELDELTRASAIRHVEQSGRAKALYSELKATKAVGTLPLVEPPADLEEKILAAEAAARKGRSPRQRFGTFVSIAASYAMRPQMAMAALLMLMVGSSLLFLRVKPGETSSVQVTERGVPESEKEVTAVVPVPEPATTPPDTLPPSHGAARARAERDDAPADKGKVAAATPELDRREGALGGSDEFEKKAEAPSRSFAPAPEAADEPAGALANGAPPAGAGPGASGGCADDLSHYEDVALHDPSPSAANAARWAAAECYAALGRTERARNAYTALLGVAGYGDRARQALAALGPAPVGEATAAASASPPAKARASSAPTSPPAAAARPSSP